MKSELLSTTTIIIRSARERTEQLCKKLILDQGVPEGHVVIVREAPFSKAMRRSFEIGMEKRLPWTYCVDADVLLRPGAIEQMLHFAESQKRNVCGIQGYMADKFFGGVRKGGVHLYRTSLLPEVVKRIPEEGTDIRPESHTLGKMKEAGYPWITVPYIVGLHDDGQYNFDIYRKSFVQAVKHLDRAELLITLWKQGVQEDPDFKVALKGFSDSIQTNRSVFINKNQQLYQDLFNESGFDEKDELNPDTYSLEQVESKIVNWEYSDLYYSYFPTRDGLDSQGFSSMRKMKRSLRERGVIRTITLAAAKLFIQFGYRLRDA